MSGSAKISTEPQQSGAPRCEQWPVLLRVEPQWILWGTAAWLAIAWSVFLAVDRFNVGGLSDALWEPMWWHLFNNRPVEWTQWLILGLAILLAGYMAGRLAQSPRNGAAAFFLIMGAGLVLMLFEEAGDARHTIGYYIRENVGSRVFGLPFQFVFDMPYFALIAALPVYAVLRYGKYAWHSPGTRGYLLVAVGMYGLAAVGSGMRHVRRLYYRLGEGLDNLVFGGQLPLHPDFGQQSAYFFLIDGPVEETIELIAAACMLAMILAYARDLRVGRIAKE